MPEDSPVETGNDLTQGQLTGHALIQSYLKTIDGSPGVYRMLNAEIAGAVCRQGTQPEGAGDELCASCGAFGADRAHDP